MEPKTVMKHRLSLIYKEIVNVENSLKKFGTWKTSLAKFEDLKKDLHSNSKSNISINFILEEQTIA